MGKINNISGKKYGLLTVLDEYTINKRGKVVWKCQCDCGKITHVIASDLHSGNTKSCGCLFRKISTPTHNYKSDRRLYGIYNGIKQRCYNLKNPKYIDYGARGIVLCDDWLKSFDSFCEWALGNGYASYLSIDRIDANGNYTPENCRWATALEQGRNTRSTKNLSYNGTTQPMSQWAKQLGISASSLRYKLCVQNLSLEEIIDQSGTHF